MGGLHDYRALWSVRIGPAHVRHSDAPSHKCLSKLLLNSMSEGSAVAPGSADRRSEGTAAEHAAHLSDLAEQQLEKVCQAEQALCNHLQGLQK